MDALYTLLRSFSLARRLALGFFLLLLIAVGFSVWAYRAVGEVAVHGPVHQRLEMGQALRASLLPPDLYMVESWATCLELSHAKEPMEQYLLVERLDKERAKLNQAYTNWSAQALDPRVSRMLTVQAHEPAVAFYAIAFDELVPAVRRQDPVRTGQALRRLTSAWVEHRQAIEEIALALLQIQREDSRWAQSRIHQIGLTLVATMVLALLLLLLLGWAFRSSVTRPLEQALAIARQLDAGDLEVSAPRRFNDEPGRLVQALVDMSHSLRDSVCQLEQANFINNQAMEMARAGAWTRDFVQTPGTIHFSQRAIRLLGFAPREDGAVTAEEMQQRMLAAAGAAAAQELQEQMREILRQGQDSWELKYPIQRELDGATMWLHDIGNVTRGPAGELVSVRGVLRDITRERMAEEAILAAMQEAEAASRAKGEFLANMSHEIRTPMNAIIGLSGLALKNEMPSRIRDYLSKIRQSGEHLLGIINDILDFSKIESGKLEVESVPFALDDVLDNVANLVGDKVDARGLALRCRVDSGIPLTLVGDPLRIGQILINLVNNAVKFTDQGEIRLEISIQELQASDVLLLFKVTDTGIGLKPEHIERLFISFQQADASTTRQYGGTGLGLAISKSLAQAMGGSIGVNSVYGEGSSFWFSARLGVGSDERIGTACARDRLGHRVPGPDEGAMAGPATHPGAGSQTAHHPPGTLEAELVRIAGARILLVEDNEINQQVACEMLASAGLVVEVADNGSLAVQQVQARFADHLPYDLVLMDMQMPVMDGVSAARLIRESHSAEQLPIVAMTANAMKVDRDRCHEAGMNDFVTKPINPEHLWKALLTWVKHRPDRVTPAPGQNPVPLLANTQADRDGAELLQALHGVAGLDVELGLSRTSYKPGFYASMLRKFIAGQEDAIARITLCLQSGDLATAERMAHTLKGVAGNLGATELQGSAARLESALREGAPEPALQAAVQETTGLLAPLMAGLRATKGLLAAPTKALRAGLSAPAHRTALQALDQIRLLLQTDDAVAGELWEQHAASLQELLDQAPAIEAAIAGFDYATALQLLEQARLAPDRV